MPGRATAEGTARYAARFKDRLASGHFRKTEEGLYLSSIGLGSYLGEPDEATDRAYAETAREVLRSGINVLDAAINYRHMRSERSLGRALAAAVEAGEVARDEILVATKGGFIAFDGDLPLDPREWFTKTFVMTGILGKDDFVGQCHAMNPAFLKDQLGRSLDNLGLETVDVYYLHNPETQRPEVGHEEFTRRLRLAFEFLEEKVSGGQVGGYGLATWNGLRVGRERLDHLSLDEIVALAREVGGESHHLCVIQLPVNLAMQEALAFPNQGPSGKTRSLLSAAREHGLTVMSSASILQGQLALPLPEEIVDKLPGLDTSAQRAIQFTRSAPGVTTALVGMKSKDHLRENLGTARVAPLGAAEFADRFGAPGA